VAIKNGISPICSREDMPETASLPLHFMSAIEAEAEKKSVFGESADSI
jgi:hypothetical protein